MTLTAAGWYAVLCTAYHDHDTSGLMVIPKPGETSVKKQINVVGAVIVKDGEILCAQRGEGGSLAGMWEFPGGKVEPGETPRAALAREVSEELLVEIRVGERVETTTYQYDFGLITLTTFFCELRSGTPLLVEHAAVQWLAPADLNALEWAPADLPAVRKISGAGRIKLPFRE